MDARQWAKELARRQAEIVMVRSDEYQTKKEIRDAFTCFTLSYPGGSRLVPDPWGLLGHGETDNSEEALDAPFRRIGQEPMDWFMSDILERNDEVGRPDLTVNEAWDGEICRESYDRKSCRYVLGRPSKDKGNIIVIGTNPSSADLGKPDPTMDNIVKTVELLGAEGYVVLNLYPWRSGNPDLLPNEADKLVLDENARAVKYVLAMSGMKEANVWAAWGGLIKKRSYLAESLRRIVATFKEHGHKGTWFQMGEGTNDGHPRHPNPRVKRPELLPWNMQPNEFDVDAYLARLARP